MSRRERTMERLRAAAPAVAPSMLKCDFARLADEVDLLDDAGAAVLHWDVMDGHFVPNLSYGAMVIERLRDRTEALFDAHLMVSDPARYLDEYLDAGCDLVTVHVEADDFTPALLDRIRDADRAAGLCLNPGTPVETITPLLGHADLVLVMSVNPGFGGQSFLPGSNGKIAAVSAGGDYIVGVDGGVGPETIAAASAAGASYFVVGSAIFGREDYGAAVRELAALAGETAAGFEFDRGAAT